MAVAAPPATTYPIALEVDGAQPQNRLSVLLRIIFAIPHMIAVSIVMTIAFVIYVISWIAILITGGYPAGLLRFSLGAFRWTLRTYGYMYLLTDKYPPFSLSDDAAYPVRVPMEERSENRNKVTTFWPLRWILAIPHLIVLYVLGIVAYVLVVIGWIAALITGSVPGGIHNFLSGYLRWYARAYGYVLNLVDEYPPFNLN